MKFKLIPLLISLVSISVLTGCNKEVEKPSKTFISELYWNSGINDYALEISSDFNEYKDLSLRIYKGKDIKLTLNLNEINEFSAKNSVVLANKDASTQTISKADYVFDNNYLLNSSYIEIVNSNEEVIDSIGYKNFDLAYLNVGSLIRMETSLFSISSFSTLNWYEIIQNDGKYLGNLDTPITYDKFLEGPKLTEEDFEKPFSDGLKALGGVTEVTISSTGDGDTTNFILQEDSGISGVERTRYYFIDCPEVDHGPSSSIEAEPWGDAAAEFTNSRITNAKHVLLQSAEGGSIRETYGRLLGFVWYTNVENPKPSDYILVNNEIVRAGFAAFDLRNRLELMNSNDILYYSYLNHSYELAVKEKIKMWGEKDPDFDYN